MAEVLLAASASAAFGPAPSTAAGLAAPSSSSASSSAAASASSTAAASLAPMEQVPQQGAVADLMAGFVAPEAAASTAPSAGGADRGGGPAVLLLPLLLPLSDEEEARLLLGLRGHGLVEDPLPRVGVVGELEGLRVGVRPPVPDAIGGDLVVEANHKGFDQVGVGLLVGRRHVGVGPGVEEPQAGGPGEDGLVLFLGGLAEGDPGDVGGGGGRKRCSYRLRRRVASWASWMAAPAARPAGSPSPTGISATYCLAAPVMATAISRRWRRLSHPLMAAVMVKFCLHPSHSAPSPELNGSVRRPPLRAAARIWRSWSAGMPAMANGSGAAFSWGGGHFTLGRSALALLALSVE